MNLKSVRVLGKSYLLKQVEKSAVADDLGACSSDEQEILIRKGLPLATEQDTTLHEVMHAVDHAMGTKLTERQIGGMATGLLAVFKDNPEFMKYLSK